ncbi:MAG: sortase [Anaerolineae bacterium]|nr:MAG: sortase [Anaerolineae bacterium]
MRPRLGIRLTAGAPLVLMVWLLAACTRPATPTVTVTLPAPGPTTESAALPRASPTPAVGARPTASPRPMPYGWRFPLQMSVPVVEVGWRIVTDVTGQRTTEWEVADGAAGHHINSAAPGTTGNVVISGHNNLRRAVFAPISRDQDQATPQLVPGSTITLFTDDGQQYVYQVQQVVRVAEENVPLAQRMANARYMEPTREPTLTLITCWPPDGFSHRVIVTASLND